MLMVCPNCHSDHIIQVQDQFFCINCGQSVPTPAVGKAAKVDTKLSVQPNGLPEGVKVLPVKAAPEVTAAQPVAPTAKVQAPDHKGSDDGIILQRRRIEAVEATAATTPKRKPGRPKAGRLDAPLPVGETVSAAPPPPSAPAAEHVESSKPVVAPSVLPDAPKIAPKRMSDISPRNRNAASGAHSHTKATHHADSKPGQEKHAPERPASESPKAHAQNPLKREKRHHVTKVAVPPLHFGAVAKASLRSRARPGYLAMSALAALALAAVAGYGAWLYLTGGLVKLAGTVTHAGALSLGEAVALLLLYYVGRSVAQGGITYGITREHDNRPVGLGRQLAIGINTFPRRLGLDIACATLAVGLLAIIGALVIAGGSDWPLPQEVQVVALFCAFLVILYLLAALFISHSLAGVAITLTPEEPFEAAKLGWHLFSHRVELIGLRLFALAMEALLALPLVAAAVGLIAAAPAGMHAPAAVGVGMLAWVCGALLGAGTAGWWAAIYRQLVLADRPAESPKLLSAHLATSARPANLTLVVALSSFLIAAALALPWLKL
jgi:hypothetical protein